MCHNGLEIFDELVALAEEHDGLLTAKQARDAGIADSVLARLTQRGRLERAARGVYRIPHFPSNRFSQYREAVLWAKADDGPKNVALSHATALAVYGISDANPALVHITIPRNARLRRVRPKWVEIHHADLRSRRRDGPSWNRDYPLPLLVEPWMISWPPPAKSASSARRYRTPGAKVS